MGAIYTSARLTLIAAAGLDPSHGLPGVSEARSSSYRDADVGNVCVAYVPPTVHRAVTMSRWSTRGWTLQEGYLSRRRLYFTESAVMFICNQGQEYEGFQLPMSESDVYVPVATFWPAYTMHQLEALENQYQTIGISQLVTTRLGWPYSVLVGSLSVQHVSGGCHGNL